MKKIDYLSTLFVGIDESSKTNTVCTIKFNCEQLLACTVTNNQPGADELVNVLLKVLSSNRFKVVMIALE